MTTPRKTAEEIMNLIPEAQKQMTPEEQVVFFLDKWEKKVNECAELHNQLKAERSLHEVSLSKAKVVVGLTHYPISELLKPCISDLEPCDKTLLDHCNEEIEKLRSLHSEAVQEEREANIKAAKERVMTGCDHYGPEGPCGNCMEDAIRARSSNPEAQSNLSRQSEKEK